MEQGVPGFFINACSVIGFSLLCISSGFLGSGILLRSRQLLPALFYLRPSLGWYILRQFIRPCICEITASMLKTQQVNPATS
jgi:hypothetical protein